MADNYGAHVWTTVVAKQIKNRLVEQVPGLTEDRVFRSNYSIEDHLKFPPADTFITMFFVEGRADQACVRGGGKYNTPFDCTLEVTLYNRLEADIENRSTRAMEDDANGVDLLLQQINTALQEYEGEVMDAEDLHSLRHPMFTDPGWRVQRRSGGKETRWVVAVSTWAVSFVADLGLLYPNS